MRCPTVGSVAGVTAIINWRSIGLLPPHPRHSRYAPAFVHTRRLFGSPQRSGRAQRSAAAADAATCCSAACSSISKISANVAERIGGRGHARRQTTVRYLAHRSPLVVTRVPGPSGCDYARAGLLRRLRQPRLTCSVGAAVSPPASPEFCCQRRTARRRLQPGG